MQAEIQATSFPAALATGTAASLGSSGCVDPMFDLGLELASHTATIGTLVVLVGGVLSWMP